MCCARNSYVFALCKKASKREGDYRRFTSSKNDRSCGRRWPRSRRSNPSWDSGGSIALPLLSIYLACGCIFRHLQLRQFGRRYCRPPANSNHNKKTRYADNIIEHTRTGGMAFLPWPRLPPPWLGFSVSFECVRQNGNLLGWKNPETTACKQAAHTKQSRTTKPIALPPIFFPATTGQDQDRVDVHGQ